MAENEQRPPSVVERAANVVVVLEGESSKKVAQALGRVLGNWGGLIATDT